MAVCDSFVNSLECVIDYNNTLSYKLIVMGVLLGYSLISLYLYRDYDYKGSMFDFFKVLLFRGGSYMYLVSLPFLLIMIRPTVTFETFVLIIASFYIIVFIIGMSLGIMFSWEKIKSLYSKEKRNTFREKYKYRNG